MLIFSHLWLLWTSGSTGARRLLCVCSFVLLNQYWGIVTVPGSFLESGDLGWPDPHPAPSVRRWLHRPPPLPLRKTHNSSVDNQGLVSSRLRRLVLPRALIVKTPGSQKEETRESRQVRPRTIEEGVFGVLFKKLLGNRRFLTT